MAITSIVPERTIDAWLAAEVISFDPFARLWAPNPRQQRNQEPWDFAVSTGRPEKLLVIENKGLYVKNSSGATCIDLDLVQLARFAWLEVAYSLPAFYGLPALQPSAVVAVANLPISHRATLRVSPYLFGVWHRVAGAVSMLAHPPIATAVAARHKTLELEVGDFPVAIGIRQFLGLAVGCMFGWDLTRAPLPRPPAAALSSAAADQAWDAAADVLARTQSDEGLRRRLGGLTVTSSDLAADEEPDVRLGQLLWAAVG